MKYVTKIFNYNAEKELADYLNSNNIKPENIVSISMGCDAKAPEHWGKYAAHQLLGLHQILLVYME